MRCPPGPWPDQPARRAANAAIPAEPQCHDGSAGRSDVSTGLVFVPQRPASVVRGARVQCGKRRPCGRPIGNGVEPGAGEVFEDPADPRRTAVEPDVNRTAGVTG